MGETMNRAVKYAEQLRARATPAERAMCDLLDENKISYVFQSHICEDRKKNGRVYIADFRIRRSPPRRPKGVSKRDWEIYRKKLFVEVDGGYHETRGTYDRQRDTWIRENRNATILRFSNDDVIYRPEMVLAELLKFYPAIRTSGRLSKTSVNYKRPRRRKAVKNWDGVGVSRDTTPRLVKTSPV